MGEVGLMQIRPRTAALLGYDGKAADLFVPETNVRLGVAYLARAWQLAKADVCRALMKYRAGWGEERMTPLSVEYCRRARSHLAALGSPLADEARPTNEEPATPVVAQQRPMLPPGSAPVAARTQLAGAPQLAVGATKQAQAQTVPLPPIRLASLGPAEPMGAQGKAPSSAPETKASPSGKDGARMQATEPRVRSAPHGHTDPRSELAPSVRVATREVVNPANPLAGKLPKAST